MYNLDLTEKEAASLRRAVGFAIMKCSEGLNFSRRRMRRAYILGRKPDEIDIGNVEFSEPELENLNRIMAALDAERGEIS